MYNRAQQPPQNKIKTLTPINHIQPQHRNYTKTHIIINGITLKLTQIIPSINDFQERIDSSQNIKDLRQFISHAFYKSDDRIKHPYSMTGIKENLNWLFAEFKDHRHKVRQISLKINEIKVFLKQPSTIACCEEILNTAYLILKVQAIQLLFIELQEWLPKVDKREASKFVTMVQHLKQQIFRLQACLKKIDNIIGKIQDQKRRIQNFKNQMKSYLSIN